MRIIFSIILLLIGSFWSSAQELVVNGGGEADPWALTGWTKVNTLDPWQPVTSQGSGATLVLPHGGSNFFFPNRTAAAISELYQDIDLSSNSVAIDAGTASYTFSGWRRGYPGTDFDQAQIIIEYRNASGGILNSFTFPYADNNAWIQDTRTQNAPVGTRSFRIRLISKRVSSGADNDGYYDDISFVYNAPTCTPPTSVQLIPNTTTTDCIGSSLFIAGVATPANANYYYTWYLNGSPITTASKTYTNIDKTVTTAADAGIYKLRVEDGNAGSATCYRESSVTIVLDPPVFAGTISSNSETCNNTIPDPFTGTPSTGGTASKYYKWQRSTGSASGPWVDVQAFNTTATGYTPTTPIALTGYYRRIDSSGTCANVATNTITIRVNNELLLDPITSLVRDTLCVGENFQLIPHRSTFPVSFNGGFYFTWKQVRGTTTTTVVPTSASMSPYPPTPKAATILDSGTYYLITQDGPTATLCKDSVKIVIRINQAPTQKALIQNHQEFCLNTPATQLTESKPSVGSIGTPVYHQWYTTVDSTGTPILSKIPAASGVNYDPGTPTTTLNYVRTDSVKYCAAVKTNFLKIRVNNKPILDSIRPTVNDTLCTNLNDQFQLKGYIDSITAGKQSVNGGFYFTWLQHQEQAIPITYIVSPTAKYTDYPAVSRTVMEADSGTYYLIVQDGINAKECMDTISFKIVVYNNCTATTCTPPDFVSIKVAPSSNAVLCTGNTLVLQKDVITLPSTPPTFGYTYSWVRTNTLGTVVVQAPSTTYQDLIINSVAAIDSGRYQLIVKDGATTPAACSERSLPISIDVYNPVTPARIGNDTTICIGNAVLPFIEVTANTGGSGSYTYQWQSSANNTPFTFTDINGQTNTTYQSPNISSTRYFRRIDKSGTCAAVSSDTITVNTTPGVTPGSIASSNPTICPNTAPTQAILSTGLASGGTGGSGSTTYQWQRSANNSNWTNIPGATAIDFTETNLLTSTTYYRRKVGMGPGNCDTSYTTSVAIIVYAPLTVGSIGGDQSVCSGTSVSLTEITAAAGNSITYQWVESSDKGTTWLVAPGASTSNVYTTPILTDTMWYKRVVISTCGQDSTNIVKIDVDTLSHPHASINDGLTCQSTNIQFTAVASNAGTTPTYTWQKKSTSGSWETITTATTANYIITNPQPIDSGTVYKVIVTSSDICNVGPDDTTVVLRVQKNIQPAVAIQTNPSGAVCDTLQSITYTAVPTNGGAAPSYQWYNGTTNALIAGATNTSYTSSSPVDGENVYVSMTSNATCTTTSTATGAHTLNLLTTPNPTMLAIDTSICIPNTILLTSSNTATSGSTFQWYKDGNPISGEVHTSYLVPAITIASGSYTFRESNGACTFTTINNADVTIIETPIVSAGNDTTVQKNSIITLQGSVSGSTNYAWTPSTGLSNTTILKPDATITNTITYTLSAQDATGLCSAQSSVTIRVQSPLVIPNVITPNGDGVNDTWNIEQINDFPNATFVIYNRWGNIVWQSTGNTVQWNGTNYRNGELLADGTYFYIIDLHSTAYSEPFTGYVQLMK